MAVQGHLGPETTYTGNLQVVRELESAITLISPDEYPLLRTVGFNSYGSVANTKFEWQEEELFPLRVYVNMATGTGTGTSITIEADPTAGGSTVGYVKPGDVLLCESEIMWVEAVSGDTLTVRRGYAGTTAVDHADDTEIMIIGNAQLEGSSPGEARSVKATQIYNVTQIWREDAEVYGSEMEIQHYGPSGAALLNDRLEKRMRELYMKMELSLLYGRRHEPTDNTEARTSGGIEYFLGNSYIIDLAGAPLEEADIIDALEAVFKDVGMQYVPDLLVGNTWPKRKVTAWYTGRIRTERAERVGGARVDRIETDFGTVDYMLDHLVKPADLFLLNTEFIKSAALGDRTLKEYDATVPGKDHVARTVFGEYGWVVKNTKTMRLLRNFSTTS